jgi:hypothetical protein
LSKGAPHSGVIGKKRTFLTASLKRLAMNALRQIHDQRV